MDAACACTGGQDADPYRDGRLLIRPPAPADIEAMHRVFSDPEVMRYLPAARAWAWARAERAERVVAIVDPANRGSVRVLHKLGMTAAGTGSYFGREWLLFVAS
jgi:RimJ/RimL family protein N-acetyltransferase